MLYLKMRVDSNSETLWISQLFSFLHILFAQKCQNNPVRRCCTAKLEFSTSKHFQLSAVFRSATSV